MQAQGVIDLVAVAACDGFLNGADAGEVFGFGYGGARRGNAGGGCAAVCRQPAFGIGGAFFGEPVQGEAAAVFGGQFLQRQAEGVVGGEENMQAARPAFLQQAVQGVEAV